MARNRWELEENRKKEKETPTQFANRVTSQLKANASAKNTSSKSSGKSSGGRSKKTTTKTTGNAAKVTKSTKSSSTGRSSGGFSNRSTVSNSREEILSGGAARRRTNIDSRTGTNTSRGAQREADLSTLKRNATDWWFADEAGRARLQAENDAIRARRGWTYNDRTGHTFMTPGGYQIRLTGSVPKEVDRIRSYDKQNWLSTAGHNIGAGLAGISQGFYNTLDFLLPDQITPKALQDYIDQAKSNAEGIRDSVRRYNYERGGTVGGVAGDLFQSAVGMLPQAVVALMSGGASTAGSLAGSADDAVSGVISALRNNAGAMTSFLSTVGTDYEQAKADGASDAEAALSAILSSAATAGIETLGGVDVPNVSTSRIRNAVRTALEEGTEEAAQGVVQNAVQSAVYDQNRPLTGSGGVFDAERMLQDFGGGALLGGAFGAARRPARSNIETPLTGINDDIDVRNSWVQENSNALPTREIPLLSAGTPTQQRTMYAGQTGVSSGRGNINTAPEAGVLYGGTRGRLYPTLPGRASSVTTPDVLYAAQNGQVSASLPTGLLPQGRSQQTRIGARVNSVDTYPVLAAVDDAGNTNGGLTNQQIGFVQELYNAQQKTGIPAREIANEIVEPAMQEYDAILQSTEQYIRDYKGQGTVVVGTDEYGRGGYRSSQNDPWYSDFYAENGRAPRKSEASDLAKTLVDSEIARGGGQFVTSEFAESYKIAQDVQTAMEALGEDVLDVQTTANGIQVSRGTPARTANLQDTNAGRAFVSPVTQSEPQSPLNTTPITPQLQTAQQAAGAAVNSRNIAPELRTAQPSVRRPATQRVQPTLQTATQASMDALRRVANPELEGTTFGANTVGAAQSGYTPKQNVSRVSSNTFRNSKIFNEAEKQSLKIFDEEGDALYDVVSERQSLQNAQDRLDADYEGEVKDLPNKPNFSGEDNDTAMGILSRKLEEARKTGNYDDVNEWAKMIKEKGTEAGQFIQSFAKYSRTPEGVVVQGQREIDAAIKYWQKKNPKQLKKLQRKGYLIWTNEDIQKSYDLMQKAEEAGVDTRQGLIYEAQAMRVIADRLPSSNKDKLVTLLMDNMLGNFRTLVARNAGGNALFAIPEGVRQQLIEAPLDAITSLFTKSRTTYFSPIKKTGAWFKGLGKGTADMASDIRHGVHTARSGDQNSVRAQQKTFRNKGLGRLGNLYDAGVGTMLEIGDRPFYEATYAAAMADLQKARDRGRLTKDFEGKDFDTYAPQVARQAALEAVFQNDGLVARGLTKAAEAIGDISRGITGTGALRQSAIPFTKTPGNLAERAIEYSPLGGLKNLAQTAGEVKSGTFDQRRFVRETSRNLVGTLLFLAAGKLVEGGILGGQLSDDKDEKEAQKNAGMQDYAIKIGDNYYSYSWIPVIGPALAGSADFYQILNNTDKNLLDAMWEAAEGYVQSAVFEQSALSNLEEMFSGYGGTMDNIGSTLASVSSQLVPSLIRQVATAADPYERQTYVSGDTLQSQLNYLKSTIPGLRQTLPIKRDEQGNEKLSSQGRGLGSRILENMFLPAKITADQSNAVRDELLRLKKSTGEVSQFQNKVTYAVERDGQKVSLTPRQSMEYQRIYGQMSTQAIEDLMNSGVYDDLSDAEKVNIITKINSYAKTIADSNFIDVELDSAQQKAYDAQQIGIGLGTYYAFTDGVTNIKNVNKGSSDSSVQNVSDIVDMLETGGFADLTEEQKDYLFDAAGYSLASNPYHISSVEQESMGNSYYQKLSGEDLYYFRSLANEYEDAVDNGKTLDGWIAKAKLAADNGIVEPYQFVALKHALLYADADENGSYKQSEVTDAINSLSGLTQYQKAYLWQAQNKNWKKNPFGGADVYWPEKEESDSSPEAVISRRIGGMSGSSEEETGNEFVNPTKASNSVITSSYGRRNAPRTSQGYGSPNHGGIDIGGTGGNLNGQAADTIGSGTVATVGYDPSGYGNYVIIDHGNGYRTLYGHLQKATVQQGQTVNAGQQIGVIGSTGNSSAPHLHLSAWYNNEEIDPATIIPGY